MSCSRQPSLSSRPLLVSGALDTADQCEKRKKECHVRCDGCHGGETVRPTTMATLHTKSKLRPVLSDWAKTKPKPFPPNAGGAACVRVLEVGPRNSILPGSSPLLAPGGVRDKECHACPEVIFY